MGLDAERGLGRLVRAAPDVRVADEVHRGVEDALLPCAERRERKRVGGVRRVLRLPAPEAQHLGHRIRRFRPRHGVVREELEVVVLRRVVRAEAEKAGNCLGAEPGGDAQAGIPGAREHRRGCIRELQSLDQTRVELRDRDRCTGVCGGPDGLLGQAGDQHSELALGERVVGTEGRNGPRHQLVGDDQLDLGLRPGLRGHAGALLSRAAVADP